MRAGEHSGYSRIAIDISRLDDWSVRKRGRRLIVTFPGRDLTFDTRQIFPLRRVTRVSQARGATSEAGSTLTLSMTCSCEADAYRFDDDMLVIDIRPQSEPTRSPSPRPAAEAEATPEPQTAVVAPTVDATEAAPPGPPPASPPAEAQVVVAEPEATEPLLQPAPEPLPDDVREAQRILLEQLSRAADQGLVEFRDGTPVEAAEPVEMPDTDVGGSPDASEDAGVSPDAPALRADPDAESPTAGPSRRPVDSGPQLAAATAFDAAAAGRDPEPELATCREEAWLDVDSWGLDEDFYGQLAERRARLVEEFDRPSHE
ncbi:MAG: hypothetical protein AAFU61_03020, partial [Pseudomonadota bacterium]